MIFSFDNEAFAVAARAFVRIFGVPYFTKQCEVRALNEHLNYYGHGSRMLDIGCGDGIALEMINPTASITVGVDINILDVLVAKNVVGESKIRNKIVFVVADASQGLCFIDRAFDRVVSLSVFEHILLDHMAFREAVRCMCKSGLFFLVVPSAIEDQGSFRFLHVFMLARNWPVIRTLLADLVSASPSISELIRALAEKYAHVRVGYSVNNLCKFAELFDCEIVSVSRTIGFWGQVATDCYNSLKFLQVVRSEGRYTSTSAFAYAVWFLAARCCAWLDRLKVSDRSVSAGWIATYTT